MLSLTRFFFRDYGPVNPSANGLRVSGEPTTWASQLAKQMVNNPRWWQEATAHNNRGSNRILIDYSDLCRAAVISAGATATET